MNTASMTFVATGADPLRVGLWRDLNARQAKIFDLKPGTSDNDAISRKQITKDGAETAVARIVRAPSGTAIQPYDVDSAVGNFLVGDAETGFRGVSGDELAGMVGDVADGLVNALAVDVKFVDTYLKDVPGATDVQKINAAIADLNAGLIGGFKHKPRDYIIDGPLDPITAGIAGGEIFGVKRKTRYVIPADAPYWANQGCFFTLGTASTVCYNTVIRDLSFIVQRPLVDDNDAEQPNVWAIWHRWTADCEVYNIYSNDIAGLIRCGGDTPNELARRSTFDVWRGNAGQSINTRGAIRLCNAVSFSGFRLQAPAKAIVPGQVLDPLASTVKINPAAGQIIDGAVFFNCQFSAKKTNAIHVDRNSAPVTNLRFLYNVWDASIDRIFWWDASVDNGQPDPEDPEDTADRIYTRLVQFIGNRCTIGNNTGVDPDAAGIVIDVRGGRVVNGVTVANNTIQVGSNRSAIKLVTNPGQTVGIKFIDNDLVSNGPVERTVPAARLSGTGWTYAGNKTTNASTGGTPRYWPTHVEVTDASAAYFTLGPNSQPPSVTPIIHPAYTVWPGNRVIVSGPAPSATEMGIAIAPGNGTDQDAAIMARVNQWRADNATGSNSFPPDASKPLRFIPGRYVSNVGREIATNGPGAVIRGDSYGSQLEGLSFTIQHNRWSAWGLYSRGAPKGASDRWGMRITGADRSLGMGGDWTFRDKPIGLLTDGTNRLYSIFGLQIEQCGISWAAIDSNGTQLTGFDLTSATEDTLFWFNAQGKRLANGRVNHARFLGGGSAKFVECYFCQVSLTGFLKRQIPILEVTSGVDSKARLKIAAKLDVTLASTPTIFVNGWPEREAETHFRLTAGTAGQIDSIVANGVSLIPSPVAYAGSLQATAAAAAAAINAGSGTHGFTAKATGQRCFVQPAKGTGTAANGWTFVVNVSGGLTRTTPTFIEIDFGATPHGLSINEWLQFKATSGPTDLDGMEPVKLVRSTTKVVLDATYNASITAGKAWKPHRLIPINPTPAVANTGGVYDQAVSIIACDDETITIDVLFASLPTLPIPGATISASVPDVLIDPVAGDRGSVNDLFMTQPNINDLFVGGGFNLQFRNARLKHSVFVAPRMNKGYQANGVYFDHSGVGRAEDDRFDTIYPHGADTGWGARFYENFQSAPGTGRWVIHATPWRGQPAVNGVPPLIKLWHDEANVGVDFGTNNVAKFDSVGLVHGNDPFQGYKVGKWYTPPKVGGAAGATCVTTTTYFTPFEIVRSVKVDAVQLPVTTADVAGNFQVAFYWYNYATGAIELIVSSAAGSLAATGTASTNLNSTGTLRPGLILLGYQTNSTTAIVRGTSTDNGLLMSVFGADTDAFSASGGLKNAITVTMSYGTWSSSIAAGSVTANANARAPIFAARIAA